MKVVCIHHSPLGGEIHLPEWAETREYQWRSLVVSESSDLPDPEELDCLVVMGGPMSAWEDGKHPWMRAEKGLIESVIRLGKPLLGVCLGAQLIAAVLGARAYRGDHQEIGWFRVESTETSRANPVGRCLPRSFETFLWHGDSFDLPEGALHLARNEVFEHQAFAYGSALALQFHLEVRPDWVRRIAARDADQLVPARTVQGLDRILSVAQETYQANNRLMDQVLDVWVASNQLRHRSADR